MKAGRSHLRGLPRPTTGPIGGHARTGGTGPHDTDPEFAALEKMALELGQQHISIPEANVPITEGDAKSAFALAPATPPEGHKTPPAEPAIVLRQDTTVQARRERLAAANPKRPRSRARWVLAGAFTFIAVAIVAGAIVRHTGHNDSTVIGQDPPRRANTPTHFEPIPNSNTMIATRATSLPAGPSPSVSAVLFGATTERAHPAPARSTSSRSPRMTPKAGQGSALAAPHGGSSSQHHPSSSQLSTGSFAASSSQVPSTQPGDVLDAPLLPPEK